jgi:hypothetical protein
MALKGIVMVKMVKIVVMVPETYTCRNILTTARNITKPVKLAMIQRIIGKSRNLDFQDITCLQFSIFGIS